MAAVIDQTGLEQPTLVAWSYGGYILANYLHACRNTRIGGINLVGAGVIARPRHLTTSVRKYRERSGNVCSRPVRERRDPALLARYTSRPLNHDELDTALAWNMVVPPAVRGALLSRELDGSDALASTSVPVLVTHGRGDAIILPSMAKHTLTVYHQPRPRRGTTVSATCRSGRQPIASTANSPTSRTRRGHDDPCAYHPAANPGADTKRDLELFGELLVMSADPFAGASSAAIHRRVM